MFHYYYGNFISILLEDVHILNSGENNKTQTGEKNNTICRKIAREKVMGFAVLRPSKTV
jgi:hypothetical protein